MSTINALKKEVATIKAVLDVETGPKDYLIYVNGVGVPTSQGIAELIAISEMESYNCTTGVNP